MAKLSLSCVFLLLALVAALAMGPGAEAQAKCSQTLSPPNSCNQYQCKEECFQARGGTGEEWGAHLSGGAIVGGPARNDRHHDLSSSLLRVSRRHVIALRMGGYHNHFRSSGGPLFREPRAPREPLYSIRRTRPNPWISFDFP
ncbi:hypothetical protein H6P81_004844 [Aristolochia fimbriata]|uniref:Uncharacterized protein n=1 Tax=Aristolochia fimbriata TaxID=158543 RepID=A0AAV7EST7_ARIFI|nr:hypothetical protein H6P81_004844 [Aristolochia fimbriata]